MKKVLSFGFYQLWQVHHQVDLTLLRALRHRGADTVIVTCDGTLLQGQCYQLAHLGDEEGILFVLIRGSSLSFALKIEA
ncbi:hypothetical protein AYO49_03015 [Verrucomicrobiaceae bacterium SCGC AG-212-N21]|nr:hypothetical protein AYO49_03015 [Verrucomicrobiaceae bacterium SCGC AG-212-N21]